MGLKFILNKRKKVICNDTMLYQIIADKTFDGPDGVAIEKGSLGGYISDVGVLSQYGSCWVAERARVISGKVEEDALVTEDAIVSSSTIQGRSRVLGNASIIGSVLEDSTIVAGTASITESILRGNISIVGESRVSFCNIKGAVHITRGSMLKYVYGAYGTAVITNGYINNRPILTFMGVGSRDGTMYAYLDIAPPHDIRVRCGCFSGTLKEFNAEVQATHLDNPTYRIEYQSVMDIIRNRLGRDREILIADLAAQRK